MRSVGARILGVLAVVLSRWPTGLRAMEDSSLQESSDAYLRNVVSELQLLNGILPASESSASYSFESTVTAPVPAPVRYVESIVDRQIPAISKYDLQPQVISKRPTYVDDDNSSRHPVPLGFTATELAAMYRKALERGSPVKYTTLVNKNQQQAPKIYGTQYEVANRPQQESQYAYYFYPLHTFRHELVNQYGYKLPDITYDSLPAAYTKKETSTMNPILVGITSFLGMALFFFVSLFVYPRFMHFLQLPFINSSRASLQDEFTHITSFVTEAIDYYNKNMSKKTGRSMPAVQRNRYQKNQRR